MLSAKIRCSHAATSRQHRKTSFLQQVRNRVQHPRFIFPDAITFQARVAMRLPWAAQLCENDSINRGSGFG